MNRVYQMKIFVFLIICCFCSTIGIANAETGYQDSGLFSINTSALSGVDATAPTVLVSELLPCHPNPFNPRTTIKFNLALSGKTYLSVYDLKGSLVKTLHAGEVLTAGSHEAVWSGRDNTGKGVAGGVYLYRLKTDGYSSSHRMTLIK